MIDDEKEKTEQPEILVVDDTPDTLQILVLILAERGYRVRPASNGLQALQSVAIKAPDLILLDVKMPDMDGYEVCRRLKADERSRDIPVLFVSGHDDGAGKVKGFEAGALDYIIKPFAPAEVLARVETHLRLRELTERLEQKVRKRTEELTAANCKLQQEISERKKIDEFKTFLAQVCSGTPAGEPFFKALARYLAESLGMDFICIDRLEGDNLNVRTVAVWCDGHFVDNMVYALKDTPCGEVVGKEVCCYPTSVCQLFPHDEVLHNLRAESYVGVTLWSHTGQPIGLLAVIGRRPLENCSLVESLLKTVALRAAGELERLDAEKALNRLNEELEQRIRDRTKELERRNYELEQMIKSFVGRELRMVELKEKIKEMEKKNSS